MTQSHIRLKEEAEVLRNCLELDLISVPQVVEWADQYIEQTPDPDFAIIEASLSMRKRADAVVKILAEVKGVTDEAQVLTRIFDVMKKLFEGDPTQDTKIARALFKMAQAGQTASEEAEGYMFWFDDALDLARLGYGEESIEQIHNQLKEFLDTASAI